MSLHSPEGETEADGGSVVGLKSSCWYRTEQRHHWLFPAPNHARTGGCPCSRNGNGNNGWKASSTDMTRSTQGSTKPPQEPSKTGLSLLPFHR